MLTRGTCCLQRGATAQRRSPDDGFVLVTVLIILGIIGAIAMILTRQASLDMRLADRHLRTSEAEFLADGVVRLVLRHLAINPPADGRSGALRLDGTPAVCRIDEHAVNLALIDTDGLVNLNLASQDMLERLIGGIAGTKVDAKAAAQAIADFRSSGDATGAGGAVSAAYEAARLPFGPKHAPFETVGELDQIPAISTDVKAILKSLVTVHSGLPIINMKVASPQVLLALDGRYPFDGVIDYAAVDALRTSLQLPADFVFIPRSRSTRTTTSKAIVVRATVHHASGGEAGRQATAALNSTNQSAANLKEWVELGLATVRGAPRLDADTPRCIGGVLTLDAR